MTLCDWWNSRAARRRLGWGGSLAAPAAASGVSGGAGGWLAARRRLGWGGSLAAPAAASGVSGGAGVQQRAFVVAALFVSALIGCGVERDFPRTRSAAAETSSASTGSAAPEAGAAAPSASSASTADVTSARSPSHEAGVERDTEDAAVGPCEGSACGGDDGSGATEASTADAAGPASSSLDALDAALADAASADAGDAAGLDAGDAASPEAGSSSSHPECTGNQHCDDGVFCNGQELCLIDGSCAAGTPPCMGDDVGPSCNDSCDEQAQACVASDSRGTPCSAGWCDGAGSCEACLSDADCGDAAPWCADGVCVACRSAADCAGAANDCMNPQHCTLEGRCEDSFKPPGAPCGDSSTTACSAADSCDGSGYCRPNHEPTAKPCGDGYCRDGACVVCTADEHCSTDVACQVPRCVNDVCTTANAPGGTACDDGAYCTVEDTCDGAGACGGSARVCQPNTSCDEQQNRCRCARSGDYLGQACPENSEAWGRMVFRAETECGPCGYDTDPTSSNSSCRKFTCR